MDICDHDMRQVNSRRSFCMKCGYVEEECDPTTPLIDPEPESEPLPWEEVESSNTRWSPNNWFN